MTKENNIKVGDLMAITYWFKVTGKGTGHLSCVDVNNNKMTFDVNGTPLIESCSSADQFTDTLRVSMTKAAELLVNAYGKPLTVAFTKQDGTTRVLRGRLVTPEPLLGRSKVEDFDLPLGNKESRMRLVDHRTIQWLIMDGMKYTVK